MIIFRGYPLLKPLQRNVIIKVEIVHLLCKHKFKSSLVFFSNEIICFKPGPFKNAGTAISLPYIEVVGFPPLIRVTKFPFQGPIVHSSLFSFPHIWHLSSEVR